MEIYVGENSTTNVVPTSTSSPAWASGGGSDEWRIGGTWLKTAPVRVIISLPVTALGLTNADVSAVHYTKTNAAGIRLLEFEAVYSYNGQENICPHGPNQGNGANVNASSSGLDVEIKATALIQFAQFGTIEVKKVVLDANGNPVADGTSFNFTLTCPADAQYNASFTLKNGESKAFTDIPVGTYYVDEINVPAGYTPQGYNREIILKEQGEYKTLTVYNVKNAPDKGHLTVQKTLTESEVNLLGSTQFTFTLKSAAGVDLSFSLTKAEILSGRNSFTFVNLAPGSYTVAETYPAVGADIVHTLTATVGGQAATVAVNAVNAAVTAGNNTLVVFTNAYTAKQPEPVTLTIPIVKTVQLGGTNAPSGDHTFYFNFAWANTNAVTIAYTGACVATTGSEPGTFKMTVSGTGAAQGAISVTGVPAALQGTQFTVTELGTAPTGWAYAADQWTASVLGSGETLSIRILPPSPETTDGSYEAMTFTNIYTDNSTPPPDPTPGPSPTPPAPTPTATTRPYRPVTTAPTAPPLAAPPTGGNSGAWLALALIGGILLVVLALRSKKHG